VNRAIQNTLSRRERARVRGTLRASNGDLVIPWLRPLTPGPSPARGEGRRRRRRGVSLMEVLVSIFVILFGMLAVGALLPVGRFEIAEALRADRAAACGRAALREVQVRGILHPALWLKPNLSPVAPPVAVLGGALAFPALDSFAIDPLFIARNGSVAPGLLQQFPFAPTAGTVFMQRATLGMVTLPNPALHDALFSRIFIWRDDLTYTLPKDATLRAQIDLSGGSPPNDGSYSWLVTVTPVVDRAPDAVDSSVNPPVLYYRADTVRKFEVAAVVFHKRDFVAADPADPSNPKPGERQVGVEFQGAGWGGGDVRLMTPLATATFINVKRNDWILLCGLDPGQWGRPVFKWYRILAVSDPEPTNPGNRMVTLAGPDWRYNVDPNTGIPNVVMGAIFEGVAGVYTETVEVGGPREY